MKLSGNRKDVDERFFAVIAAAIAAGLVAAGLTLVSKQLHYGHISISFYTRTVLLALLCYVIVAMLFHKFSRGILRKLVPTCIVLVFVGTAGLILVELTPPLVAMWVDPLNVETSLYAYILRESKFIIRLIIARSLIALPIAGLVYFVTDLLLERRERRNCQIEPTLPIR